MEYIPMTTEQFGESVISDHVIEFDLEKHVIVSDMLHG